MTAPEANRPTRRCRVIDTDNAVDEIRAFLDTTPAGERAWCEVFYPAPPRLTPDEKAAWETRQLDTFDAIELVDGELVTLPPYDLDDLLVGPTAGGGAA